MPPVAPLLAEAPGAAARGSGSRAAIGKDFDITLALGEPPPMISEAEHLLRDQVHDVLHPHHDEDFRTFRTFQVEELQELILEVWRVDVWGRLRVDRIIGERANDHISVIRTGTRGYGDGEWHACLVRPL